MCTSRVEHSLISKPIYCSNMCSHREMVDENDGEGDTTGDYT